ncbi:Aspartyl protease family protein [Bosea sp. 62]|uniref:retropepsin-like aspartic protease family protein n=1 Tax=unclassified Bosea (in: a-proteobacteria) TaxID=2653178 RepID=UPI00125C30AC|nr:MULTISPECIES: TIGR02281 family clan AA aspartic protease [unclassified Bosea (in: a-proteobacteria)]CAD5284704.1 Aspartyl protease family protein [Bosea sp. 21B]CAD5287460.1 Aspartyl protease family protein [Bosea sp. 46]CAD5301638.1 Aspartyl protease family protein [Bosea sp. 7B]VVT51327.1 Aspartyl protease family protein [Bosea sp. EC-HK365B]VXB11987.1 Aspartyl protease family protein [Bosea sp. 62]
MAQRPIVWFLGVAGVAGLAALNAAGNLDRMVSREPAPARAAPSAPAPAKAERVLTVNADYRGHYVVHPAIDNYRVKMMVDTGASLIVLTDADARALGIRPDRSAYSVGLGTANGVVRGAKTMLREVRLGDISVRDVEAVVLPAGALSVSLLGTSFLRRLRGYEVQGGRMVLRG